MASSLPASPSLAKRRASRPSTGHDNDLSQSLKNLSLSASSTTSRSPSFRSPADHSAPASTSRRPSFARSPLNGASPTNAPASRSGTPTGTPTLLRKASVNSLHSVAGVGPPRRASSVNLMSPSARKRSPLRSVSPDPQAAAATRPAPTASSIANTHFRRELELWHAAGSADADTDTLVLLNDACYGHRYSRPRTSRAALSTVVERPERIKAGALGVAAAYVRLGGRHADGAFPPHPRRDAAALPSIPFRIQKTVRRLPLTSPTVTNVHGTKWMEELKTMCDSAEARLATSGKELQRPETTDTDATPHKLHEGDLYLCAESLDAMEGALGAVCEAVDTVFADSGGGPKRAFVGIRPPGHHCSAAYPSGFCWVNNVHVGVMHAILGHGLTHAAIVDFDLHHGDGSQAIAWQHNARGAGLGKNAAWWKKTSIGYFSLHDINSFPCESGDADKVRNASVCVEGAHGQSMWNVHLRPWKSESEFWEHYELRYALLLDKVRGFLRGQTERLRAAGLKSKAAIFLSAGFDASEHEGAGMQRHNVNVPTEFYARFTRDVVRLAAEEGTSAEGRIVSVLEGGYSDRALYSGVLSHLCGLAGDDPVAGAQSHDFSGLGYEMGQRIGSVSAPPRRKDSSASERGTRPYEPSWWARPELDHLDDVVAPPPPPPPSGPQKTARKSSAPTFFSATQSSAAKMVATPKLRRSVSGMSLNSGSPSAPVRPPTPPPPEVEWAVATHELTKLLVPADRQTDSCRHEDLSAEATRARRDRHSALVSQSRPEGSTLQPAAAAAAAPTRMSLRERKAKPVLPLTEEDDEKEYKNRRNTVGATVSAAEKASSSSRGTAAAARRQPNRPGRRLSAASTAVEGATTTESSSRLSSRPATAQSVRPESSMSGRSYGPASLAVKKTRTAATAPKKETAAGSRNSRIQNKKTTTPPVPEEPSSGSPPSTAADPVDALAGDMKKIKITLVTKEQREARERERAERERRANVQRPASIPEQQDYQQDYQQQPVISLGESIPELSVASTPNQDPGNGPSDDYFLRPDAQPTTAESDSATEPTAASPVSPRTCARRDDDVQPSTPDVFVSYQPDGPDPEAIPPKGPLQWLPPNTATPVPTPVAVRAADLPVFTSTSAIPFAPRPASASGSAAAHSSAALTSTAPASTPVSPRKSRPVDRSIWGVPE